jgi:acetoin utilization protein AcuB
MPVVGDVMTLAPVTVGIDAPVSAAQDLMVDHEIRHLPVVDADELVGIISDRDIAALENDPRSGSLVSRMTVRDLCSFDHYSVGSGTALPEVLLEMAERRIGSVVVTDGNGVLGVFTATDACRVFAEHLRASLE